MRQLASDFRSREPVHQIARRIVPSPSPGRTRCDVQSPGDVERGVVTRTEVPESIDRTWQCLERASTSRRCRARRGRGCSRRGGAWCGGSRAGRRRRRWWWACRRWSRRCRDRPARRSAFPLPRPTRPGPALPSGRSGVVQDPVRLRGRGAAGREGHPRDDVHRGRAGRGEARVRRPGGRAAALPPGTAYFPSSRSPSASRYTCRSASRVSGTGCSHMPRSAASSRRSEMPCRAHGLDSRKNFWFSSSST